MTDAAADDIVCEPAGLDLGQGQGLDGVEPGEDLEELTLPLADDWHMHLRQGDMARVVVPLVRRAGVQRGIVMPNTIPAVTTTAMALDYRAELCELDDLVDYKMLLYLSPDLTPDDLQKGKDSGLVTGVKSYPRGVTTNSDAGVESYEQYYPQFRKMEELGLVLHLHGEVPGECVMEAEGKFIGELEKLARDFPGLKIVMEHVSTKAAVEAVLRLGPNVAASVTAHHLDITIDQVVGCCHYFCKPVPKLPSDRNALRQVVFSGHPKFFFGSDSAPHPRSKKEGGVAAAGVYTGAAVIQYLAHIFGEARQLHRLPDFVGTFGATFLGHPLNLMTGPRMRIFKKVCLVPDTHGEEILGKENAVVPFRAGQVLDYQIEILD
ncbi:unnamed protein product [Amoebophrya sp. A25]|nr:unnamed protein product [Amoebophrya sp. A25]|eukprot:GSA25T00005603001.1